MSEVAKLMKRNALIFSDGSFTVFAEDWPIEKIYAEQKTANDGAKPSDRTKVARVTVVIDEILADATTLPEDHSFCASCKQAVAEAWAYCPHCGYQSRPPRKEAS